jgi:hypothetical protein
MAESAVGICLLLIAPAYDSGLRRFVRQPTDAQTIMALRDERSIAIADCRTFAPVETNCTSRKNFASTRTLSARFPITTRIALARMTRRLIDGTRALPHAASSSVTSHPSIPFMSRVFR